ncbi:hypothetical protein D3C79_1105880 [compost metagenome]
MLVGVILDHFKMLDAINAGYNILFVMCALAYVLAWCVVVLVRGKCEQIEPSYLPARCIGNGEACARGVK